jgi:casein kinase I family protein HRR25
MIQTDEYRKKGKEYTLCSNHFFSVAPLQEEKLVRKLVATFNPAQCEDGVKKKTPYIRQVSDMQRRVPYRPQLLLHQQQQGERRGGGGGGGAALFPHVAVGAGGVNANRPVIATHRAHFERGDTIGPYQLDQEIASGAFGKVFRATHREDGQVVAIKIARNRATAAYQLINEFIVLKRVNQMFPPADGGFSGFPSVKWIGESNDDTFLAMELLGPDLHTLLQRAPQHRFSLKTVLMVGVQLIDCLERLHGAHYLHCDLKPENIVIRSEDARAPGAQRVCLLDLGLTHLFWDETKSTHAPIQVYDHFNGTAKYASINAHEFLEPSRRDDLEALIFVLLYLLSGTLPWEHIQDPESHLYEAMIPLKQDLRRLPGLSHVDTEFFDCLHQVRLLHFDETPDYARLRDTLRACATRRNLLNLQERTTHTWNWSQLDWVIPTTTPPPPPPPPAPTHLPPTPQPQPLVSAPRKPFQAAQVLQTVAAAAK